jgi:hypothetical protein
MFCTMTNCCLIFVRHFGEDKQAQVWQTVGDRLACRLAGCLLLGGAGVGGPEVCSIAHKIQESKKYKKKKAGPLLKAWEFRRLMMVSTNP